MKKIQYCFFSMASSIESFWDEEPYKNPNDFEPTEAPAGSKRKLEILAERVRRGLPLWHPEDRVGYDDLVAAVRPRDDSPRHYKPKVVTVVQDDEVKGGDDTSFGEEVEQENEQIAEQVKEGAEAACKPAVDAMRLKPFINALRTMYGSTLFLVDAFWKKRGRSLVESVIDSDGYDDERIMGMLAQQCSEFIAKK